MGDVVPRRNRLDQNTPTELLIREAVDAVEQMGADVRLTEAVILLGQAREKVADYVDEKAGYISARRAARTVITMPELAPPLSSLCLTCGTQIADAYAPCKC